MPQNVSVVQLGVLSAAVVSSIKQTCPVSIVRNYLTSKVEDEASAAIIGHPVDLEPMFTIPIIKYAG